MLKKIQHVWNFILKKKKISNNTNLYKFKNNFNFTNMISTSLVFFITSINKIKLKKIKIIDKTQPLLSYYTIFFFFTILCIFSIILYLFFLF